MNTFYYFEGRIFETLESAQSTKKSMGSYGFTSIDKIETNKTFEEFENEFDKCKKDGDSDLDAIEWAK